MFRIVEEQYICFLCLNMWCCPFVYLPQGQGLHLGFLQTEHWSLTSGSLPQTDEHKQRQSDLCSKITMKYLNMFVLTLSLLSWSCSMTFIFRRVSSSFLSSWRRLSIVDECFYSITAHKSTRECLSLLNYRTWPRISETNMHCSRTTNYS